MFIVDVTLSEAEKVLTNVKETTGQLAVLFLLC
jgi:hypothetical protein